MTEDRYNWLEGQACNLDRMTLVGSEIRCYCPDDCNCHYSWRPNYCGCKQHEQPTASERIRAARETAEERYVARYRDGYYVVIDTTTGKVVPSPAHDYKKFLEDSAGVDC